MSTLINTCRHKNMEWKDVINSLTGEPSKSGYCPDCHTVTMLSASGALLTIAAPAAIQIEKDKP